MTAPVPDWHMEIIEERLAEYEKNGFEGIPWEEVEKELTSKIDRRLNSHYS